MRRGSPLARPIFETWASVEHLGRVLASAVRDAEAGDVGRWMMVSGVERKSRSRRGVRNGATLLLSAKAYAGRHVLLLADALARHLNAHPLLLAVPGGRVEQQVPPDLQPDRRDHLSRRRIALESTPNMVPPLGEAASIGTPSPAARRSRPAAFTRSATHQQRPAFRHRATRRPVALDW